MKTFLLEENIKEIVERACREVEKNDAFLFMADVSEWAVAHRLAVYLEKYFPEYDVDCEYNRMADSDGTYSMHSPKRVHGTKKSRPDIIVHRRGPDSIDNLLVIELKKGAAEDSNDSVFLKAIQTDQNFNYNYAFQVLISDNKLKILDKTI